MCKIAKIDNSIAELQQTQKLCQMLMQSPHYKKAGADGIYAIVEMSKSVGIDPLQALNGGMYFVKGKVEMSSTMMNTLIRQAGHSVTKDKKSDETICILHGRRVDNGDTWVESFSIGDAQKAGLTRNPTWSSYPKDMLFARALSRLARQLFPDVIKGCYVQDELPREDVPIVEAEVIIETIGEEGAKALSDWLSTHDEYEKQVESYLDRQGIELKDLTIEDAAKIKKRLESLDKGESDE